MNAPTYDPTNGQDRAWLAGVFDDATVYVVLQADGVAVELDTAWRSYEEAEERRDAQERAHGRYGWHIQALPLQGAR